MNKLVFASVVAFATLAAPIAFAFTANDQALQRLDDVKNNMSTGINKGGPALPSMPITALSENDRAQQRLADAKDNMSTGFGRATYGSYYDRVR